MKKAFKITGITLLALLFLACLVIDCWYLAIVLNGDEKVVSKTFNVGTFELADGSQKRFMEVEYWANKDGSGQEVYEIKFNYLMDENKEYSYSQGLQYVNTANDERITFTYDLGYSKDEIKVQERLSGFWVWARYNYSIQHSHVYTSGGYYNYASAGNDEYLRSTNPIDSNTFFKIEIGDQLYLMKLKGGYGQKDDGNITGTYGTPLDESTLWTTIVNHGNIYNYYAEYNITYLAAIVLSSIRSAKYGTNCEYVFEFGNLFDYYAYNSQSGQYDEDPTSFDKTVKLSEDIKSYYSVFVKVHEDGLTKASDSMFGSFMGNQNFNMSESYDQQDYFIGRTIISADNSVFDKVLISEDEKFVALKLNKDFINFYSEYKQKIELEVAIDLDVLEAEGYEFVGFTTDNGLTDFNIRNINLISNGVATAYGGDL